MNCPQLLLELIFFSWTAATTNGHFWSLALLIGLGGAMKQLGRLQAASTSVTVEMKVLVGQQLIDGELETKPECSSCVLGSRIF